MFTRPGSSAAALLAWSGLVCLLAQSLGHPAFIGTAALRRQKRPESCVELKQAKDDAEPLSSHNKLYARFVRAAGWEREGDEAGERVTEACKGRGDTWETECDVVVVRDSDHPWSAGVSCGLIESNLTGLQMGQGGVVCAVSHTSLGRMYHNKLLYAP